MSRLTENLKRLEEMGKLNKHHMGILENSLEEHDKEIRNKAIDEFVRRLKNHPYAQYHLDGDLKKSINEIAEQLKAGGEQ